MKKVMLIASMLMVVALMFSMVGCMAHGRPVQWEMREQVTVRQQQFSAEKPVINPDVTAEMVFSQRW